VWTVLPAKQMMATTKLAKMKSCTHHAFNSGHWPNRDPKRQPIETVRDIETISANASWRSPPKELTLVHSVGTHGTQLLDSSVQSF
jgi:hypothetical protein